MYTLTLTRDERKAIDWVGYRDWNGDDLYHLLWRESTQTPDDADWLDGRPITFTIPEPVAWRLLDLYTYHGCHIPHFADTLSAKLQVLLDSIV